MDNTYEIKTSICKIVLEFRWATPQEFFEMVDEDRFIEAVTRGVTHSGYKDIEINFLIEIKMKDIEDLYRTIKRAIKERNARLVPQRSRRVRLAYVDTREILAGNNIVRMDFTKGMMHFMMEIFNHYASESGLVFPERKLRYGGKELFEMIKGDAERNYIAKLYDTLVHEITHLWHIKKSRAIDFQRRNSARFNKILNDSAKEIELSGAINNLFRFKDWETFKRKLSEASEEYDAFYILLRRNFTKFHQMLCAEGVARFMEEYVNGVIDHEVTQRDAIQKAEDLQRQFIEFIHAFSFIIYKIRQLKTKIRLKQRISFPFSSEEEYEYESNLTKIGIFANNLRSSPYVIGKLLPATLYVKGGYSIEEIGSMNPNRLIKNYVKVCQKHGLQRVVSISHFSGAIFHIRKNINEFNSLRKRLY